MKVTKFVIKINENKVIFKSMHLKAVDMEDHVNIPQVFWSHSFLIFILDTFRWRLIIVPPICSLEQIDIFCYFSSIYCGSTRPTE